MRKKAEVSHEVYLSLHYLGFTSVRRSASCVHVWQKGLKPHNHRKVAQNPYRKNTFYAMEKCNRSDIQTPFADSMKQIQ